MKHRDKHWELFFCFFILKVSKYFLGEAAAPRGAEAQWGEDFHTTMATQGGIVFQEKVSRLLRGQNGKPVLKPNRALVLKDAVANRKPKKGGKNIKTWIHQRGRINGPRGLTAEGPPQADYMQRSSVLMVAAGWSLGLCSTRIELNAAKVTGYWCRRRIEEQY